MARGGAGGGGGGGAVAVAAAVLLGPRRFNPDAIGIIFVFKSLYVSLSLLQLEEAKKLGPARLLALTLQGLLPMTFSGRVGIRVYAP